CCFQTGASAWLGASTACRDDAADVVDRYCTEGNYCWQAGLRVARGFLGRRLIPNTVRRGSSRFAIWGPYAIWRANRSPLATRFATIAFWTATKRASS